MVTNTGEAPFSFQSLQHTYLDVGDIAATTVQGLRGGRFMDKTSSNPAARNVEMREDATIVGFTDRVYTNLSAERGVESKVVIKTPKGEINVVGSGTMIEGDQEVSMPSDVVMWNPWAEKAAGMADFDDEGYKSMLCIEPGFVSEFHVLQPKARFNLKQSLRG